MKDPPGFSRFIRVDFFHLLTGDEDVRSENEKKTMKNPTSNTEVAFARIVKSLKSRPRVTIGMSKRGFGSSALCVSGRIFAMVTSKETFVVKLPKERVDVLVASGEGQRFDPGHGRVMREWLVVESPPEGWLPLAREAMAFVGSKK